MSRVRRAHPVPQEFRPRDAKGLAGRVLIGERLAGGVEPPEELLPGILLAGKLHKVFSGPGDGKTFLALWIALEVVRRAKTVLYLDAENGPGVAAERLEDLGADPEELDQRFHYYPSPDLTLEADALEDYRATLGEGKPDLVIFDSWVDFLTIAGLEENSATEVTSWVHAFAVPAKERGAAVLVLDHVPVDANRSRGSTQKLGKVDVSWRLKKSLDFDRRKVGQLELRLEKDREGWLPARVRFAIGGGESGFVFRKDAQVFEQVDPADGLTEKQRQALGYLEDRTEVGAGWKELLDELGGSKGTLSRTLSELSERGLISKKQGRYYPTRRGSTEASEVPLAAEPPNGLATPLADEGTAEPESGLPTPEAGGSAGFRGGSIEPAEPDTPGGGSGGSTTLEGGTMEPGVEPNGSDQLPGDHQGAEEESVAKCIHGLAGGRGCYLCDPDHPSRKGAS